MATWPNGEKIYLAAAGDAKVDGVGSQAILHTFTLNKAVASAVVTIYDGQSTTGSKVATIDASVAALGSLVYDIRCANGVYAVMTGGNADITISVL